jgi:hypothetical protein
MNYTFICNLQIKQDELIFRHIFLSNYWWQRSDIWSQASYRYPILWEAFFDPSDSYFLFAEEWGYHRWALAHSSSCWTLPTIWYTYMMLVTKYQIFAINSYWEKCDEKYLGRMDRRTEVKQYTPLPSPQKNYVNTINNRMVFYVIHTCVCICIVGTGMW